MAPSAELKANQNNSLCELLLLREINKKAGIKIMGMSQAVSRVKAGMSKEDIAWVEQQVAHAVDEDM